MLAEPPGVWLRVLNVNPSCLFAWKLCRAALILCSPSGMWSHSEPSSSPATALLQILVAAPGFLLPGGIRSQPLFVTDGVPDQRAPASFCHHRWSLTNRWWLQSSVFTSQNTVIPAQPKHFFRFKSSLIFGSKYLIWLHKHEWKCANLTSKIYVLLSAKMPNKVSLKKKKKHPRCCPQTFRVSCWFTSLSTTISSTSR